MIRKTIKTLKLADEAYVLAREAGFSQRESINIARDVNLRNAFVKLATLRRRHVTHFVDIGTNRGQFLELVLARFNPTHIIGVEPLPDAFAELETRFETVAGTQFLNCAVGSQSGNATLQVNQHDQASSLLPIRETGELRFTHHDLTPLKEIVVPVRTLDEIVQEAGWPHIDLLKLDVQGFELEVLKGAELALAMTDMVLMEVAFYSQYEGDVLFDELHRFMQTKQFNLHWLGHYQRAKTGAVLQGDAVYVRGEA